MANDSALSASILALATCATTFTTTLPPLSEIRRNTNNQVVVNDVRMAEKVSAASTLLIGVAGSVLTDSPAPLIMAISATVLFIIMYESVLSSTPKEIKDYGKLRSV